MSNKGFLQSLFSTKEEPVKLLQEHKDFDPEKYFFGEVCKRNLSHGRIRYISSGGCCGCSRERKRNRNRNKWRERESIENARTRRRELAQKQAQELAQQVEENKLEFSNNGEISHTAQMIQNEEEIIKKEEKPVTVYFLGYETNEGPIKIGHSVNEENRLERLQVAHPYTITIITKFQGTREDEDLLHEFFSHNRLRGEWFRRDEVILKVIHMIRRGIPFSDVISHFNMKK